MALYTRVDNADGTVVRMGIDDSMADINGEMGNAGTILLNRITAIEDAINGENGIMARLNALDNQQPGDPSIDIDPYTPQG